LTSASKASSCFESTLATMAVSTMSNDAHVPRQMIAHMVWAESRLCVCERISRPLLNMRSTSMHVAVKKFVSCGSD
jgi:hypothetical protein